METMKALVYLGPGKLELQEREIPHPKPGEVRVKIAYTAVCGSDLGAYRQASDRFEPPLILGHEFSGIIDEVGEGVDDRKIGRHVCGNPPVYCGTCWYCRHGHYNICPNRLSLGNTAGAARLNGTYTEYICLPAFTMVPLPEEMDLIYGSMMEPLAVGYHAAANGGFTQGENTVVIGAGPIGLMTVMSLKAQGAGHVIVSDTAEARRRLALRLGADTAVDPAETDLQQAVMEETDGLGADRTIICTETPSVFRQAIDVTRSCGDVVLVGMIQKKLEFCPMDIFSRDINIISSYTFTDEIYEAVKMVHEGRILLEPMITSIYSLEYGKAAFDALAAPQSPEVKVIVDIEGRSRGTEKWVK